MSTLDLLVGPWLPQTLLGGGLLLLLARALAGRLRQPARRQRLAELAVLSALLITLFSLGPRWLVVPLPPPPAEPQPVAVVAAPPELAWAPLHEPLPGPDEAVAEQPPAPAAAPARASAPVENT